MDSIHKIIAKSAEVPRTAQQVIQSADLRKQIASDLERLHEPCRWPILVCEAHMSGTRIHHMERISSGILHCPFFIPGPGSLSGSTTVRRLIVRPTITLRPLRRPLSAPLISSRSENSFETESIHLSNPLFSIDPGAFVLGQDAIVVAQDDTIRIISACQGRLLIGVWISDSKLTTSALWDFDLRKLAFIQPLLHSHDFVDWYTTQLAIHTIPISRLRTLHAPNNLYITVRWISGNQVLLSIILRSIAGEQRADGKYYHIVHPQSMKVHPKLARPISNYNWSSGSLQGSLRRAAIIQLLAWEPFNGYVSCAFTRLVIASNSQESVLQYKVSDAAFKFSATVLNQDEAYVQEMYLELP